MNNQSNPAADSWLKFLGFILIATVITFAYPTAIAEMNDLRTPQQRSTFGDQFGALNALTSALAFGALIYTVMLQRRDLDLQRTELELQRVEMKESRAELSKQAQAQAEYVQATLLAARINGVGQALTATLQSGGQPLDQLTYTSGPAVHVLYLTLQDLLEQADSLSGKKIDSSEEGR